MNPDETLLAGIYIEGDATASYMAPQGATATGIGSADFERPDDRAALGGPFADSTVHGEYEIGRGEAAVVPQRHRASK